MSAAKGQGGPVLVVAGHREGRLSPLTLELAACGQALADALGLDAKLVVIADQPEPLAREAAQACLMPAAAVRVPGLEMFHGQVYASVLAELAATWGAAAIIGGHDTCGLDWAPGLAAALGAACVTGVERLEFGPEGPRLARATLFGKVVEDVVPQAWPLVITVQPGAFASSSAARSAPGGSAQAVETITATAPETGPRVLGLAGESEQDAALKQAQVVVAAGRGIGKPERLDLVRRLAGLFSGAAVAGSRPVCDQGWLPYRSQVGLTGATVAPRLYLALGISGALQHTAGMQGSGFIVAVNSDPHAAIFNLADVCVVEDLTVFLPALLDMAGRTGRDDRD